ncbi:MAG: TetR/AcrR family transcriptional regulator [Anaerolineales bacterium]|nr:TetR/AcrR family transcriptional regulator [Anaerolineales bacterium]
MTQPENNLRVRRTQKLLRDALIELIEEQSFDALTVGEITKRAMVSRAAFYRNYQDKYDLVEQIFAEAMQALFNAVLEIETAHSPQIWVKFFEHIAEYERLYRALLGRKGSPWFVLKMRAALVDLVKEFGRLSPQWSPDAAPPIYPTSDEFVPDLVATMFVEAITWWLEQGRPYPPEEIAKRCILLAGAIFKETSTWQ